MLPAGTILEKYEILEQVGEGGMATVYRGRHMTLSREVAIKVLHPHLASSEKNRVRFEREARAIEGLGHPNILRIFDYSGASQERCFIVTEFIHGPTLRALLDDVGLMMSEPGALIGRELCLALEVAHARGIVHRDVKPENVMIDQAGITKLMDFGIARIMDESHVTVTGALVGSPAYMSPEQATDGQVDARSDIFSLGTLLYRMVTGAMPFRGGNPSVVLKAIIDGVFDDPVARVPSLSPRLAALIRRCLARDRQERPPSALAVRIELEAVLRDVGIHPEEPREWGIGHYLEAPEPYEERLRAFIVPALVGLGGSQQAEGQTAAALKTFQRVLALDEDNREVIASIEGLRPLLEEEQRPPRPPRRWPWAAGIVAALGLTWVIWPDRPPEPVLAMPTLPTLGIAWVDIPPESPTPESTPEPTPESTPEAPTPRPNPTQRTAQLPTPTPTRTEPTPAPSEATPPAAVAPADPPCTLPGRLRVVVGDGIHSSWVEVWNERTGELAVPRRLPPVDVTLPPGRYRVESTSDYLEPSAIRDQWVCGEQPGPRIVLRDRRLRPTTLRLRGFADGAEVYVDDARVGTVASTHSALRIDKLGTFSVSLRDGGVEVFRKVLSRTLDGRGDALLPGEELTLALAP